MIIQVTARSNFLPRIALDLSVNHRYFVKNMNLPLFSGN